VAPVETECAFGAEDVAHGAGYAEPGAGVFCELGVGGLEEDLDAVEGGDEGFGLSSNLSISMSLMLRH
jgi:hypothetical protein